MNPSEDTDRHKAGDQEDASTPFQPQTLLRPRSATIHSEQPEVISNSSRTQGSVDEGFPSAAQGSYNLGQGIRLGNFDRPAPSTTSNQNVRPMLSIKSEEVPRRFGCPYYKRSPNEEPKQFSCVYPGFERIARLKEHLYRHHIQLRCFRCNETFKNDDAALDEHLHANVHCTFRESQRDYGEGLDQDQRSRLKKRERKSDTRTDEHKWRDIYQTLFPDDEAVPTPDCYVTPQSEQEYYRRYCQENSDRVLGEKLGAIPSGVWSGSDQKMKQLMCDVQEQLFVEFHAQQNEDERVLEHDQHTLGFGSNLTMSLHGIDDRLNESQEPPPGPELPTATGATADDIWGSEDEEDKKKKKGKSDPDPDSEPEPEPVIVNPEPEARVEPYVSSPASEQESMGPLTSDFPSITELTSDKFTLVDSTPTGTTMIDTQTEATTFEGQLPFPNPGPSEQHLDTGYDYASVVSNDEDIASKSGNYRSREEVLAVKELGHFFAELEELLPLHQELLEKLGPERFSKNYRRVLKLYFLGLQREAKTTVEKQTALVLRKRINKYTIGQRVANSIQNIGMDDLSQLDELSSQQVQKELDDWLAQLDNTAPQQSIDGQNECTDESSDESNDEAEDGDHYEDIRIASIEQAKVFLRRGDPFRDLVLQLRLLALPLSIRDVLDMASRDSIYISSINDRSLINRVKAVMEDYTGVEWDWWPLMPRVPDVTRNRFQLQWQLCGKVLYSEISPNNAESLRNILAVMDSSPPECSSFGKNPKSLSRRSPSVSFFEKIRHWAKQTPATSSFAPNPSTAQQRYTPTGAARTSSGAPSNSNSGQNIAAVPSSSAVQSGGLAQAYGVDHNGTPGSHNNDPRIIFGIRSKYGLDHIEAIGTRDDLDDSSFFGELKSRHDIFRPFLHRWLSPFRFRYCNFVRFEHVFDDPLFSSEEGLPAWLNNANVYEHDPDYDYSPKPPRTKNPPIDPKLFSACLAACNTRCGWSSMSVSLHKCRFLSKTSQKWMRIPRKKTALTKDDRVMFGIEAEYALSFAMLFVYHAVLILAAFAFWIYWLKNHPDDLQNASVPIFTVLGLMGAFWGLLGGRLGAV